ncbi:hypothetical protein [Actomonas aquatica]|uniref:Uncharacterized protein n=1 Tax=Actomonas aquatica TaxID=2866162 RepID=A0ABZ1C2Y3_9BACT|nr:hypothetical protein [Opitutus sp. WL0086]WRQ86067.1 hypothetical protein K1X11_014730 [Opitutus sp. WL0086]
MKWLSALLVVGVLSFFAGRWSAGPSEVVVMDDVAEAVVPMKDEEKAVVNPEAVRAMIEEKGLTAPELTVRLKRALTADELVMMLQSLQGMERFRAKLALHEVFGERGYEIPWLLGQSAYQARSTTLSDGFVEAFELTAAERQRLEIALSDALSASDRLALERAKYLPSADGSELVIEVPVFPEEGARVFDQLYGRFTEVLGAERLDLFNETYVHHLEKIYNGIGTRTHTVRVKLSPDVQATGRPIYEVVQEFSQRFGTNTTTSRYINWADVLEAAAPFAHLLPTEPPAPVATDPESTTPPSTDG